MIVDDLTKGLRNKLDEIMSIKNSLCIMNVPKQSLLDKGDLVILLNDNNKPIIVEFLKDGHYHVEFKNTTFPKLLLENIMESDKVKLFETTDFDSEFDNDSFIYYNELSTQQKKDVRTFIKNAEAKLVKEHQRFGKMSESCLKKTIKVQNGIFTVWMQENGFETPNKECLQEAYKQSVESNDAHLKKRAAAAKCFHKIAIERNNGKK